MTRSEIEEKMKEIEERHGSLQDQIRKAQQAQTQLKDQHLKLTGALELITIQEETETAKTKDRPSDKKGDKKLKAVNK